LKRPARKRKEREALIEIESSSKQEKRSLQDLQNINLIIQMKKGNCLLCQPKKERTIIALAAEKVPALQT